MATGPTDVAGALEYARAVERVQDPAADVRAYRELLEQILDGEDYRAAERLADGVTGDRDFVEAVVEIGLPPGTASDSELARLQRAALQKLRAGGDVSGALANLRWSDDAVTASFRSMANEMTTHGNGGLLAVRNAGTTPVVTYAGDDLVTLERAGDEFAVPAPGSKAPGEEVLEASPDGSIGIARDPEGATAARLVGCGCLETESVRVATPLGLRVASDLAVGDMVYTHGETGVESIAAQPITALRRSRGSGLRTVYTSAGAFTLTADHPVAVMGTQGRTWRTVADSLRRGMRLAALGLAVTAAQAVTVDSVGASAKTGETFDLAVEGGGGYYVAAGDAAVAIAVERNACHLALSKAGFESPSIEAITGALDEAQVRAFVADCSARTAEKNKAFRDWIAGQGDGVEGRVKAWEVLPKGLRTEVFHLESVAAYLSKYPGEEAYLKGFLLASDEAEHASLVRRLGENSGSSEFSYDYREIELVNPAGSNGGELDGIDMLKQAFIEDKSAENLYLVPPNRTEPVQTPAEWVQKQIVVKTDTRIAELEVATRARPTNRSANGSETAPRLSDIQSFRKLQFRIELIDGPLSTAMEEALTTIRTRHPDWDFSVVYGSE